MTDRANVTKCTFGKQTYSLCRRLKGTTEFKRSFNRLKASSVMHPAYFTSLCFVTLKFETLK